MIAAGRIVIQDHDMMIEVDNMIKIVAAAHASDMIDMITSALGAIPAMTADHLTEVVRLAMVPQSAFNVFLAQNLLDFVVFDLCAYHPTLGKLSYSRRGPYVVTVGTVQTTTLCLRPGRHTLCISEIR